MCTETLFENTDSIVCITEIINAGADPSTSASPGMNYAPAIRQRNHLHIAGNKKNYMIAWYEIPKTTGWFYYERLSLT